MKDIEKILSNMINIVQFLRDLTGQLIVENINDNDTVSVYKLILVKNKIYGLYNFMQELMEGNNE